MRMAGEEEPPAKNNSEIGENSSGRSNHGDDPAA